MLTGGCLDSSWTTHWLAQHFFQKLLDAKDGCPLLGAGGLLRLLLCCWMMLGQIRDPVDAPTRCCLYLNCPTRKNGTLDLLHANVREADTSISLPPLGKSDYNLFVLKPYYRTKIKRLCTNTHSLKKWSPEAFAVLRESTDSSIMTKPDNEDIKGITQSTWTSVWIWWPQFQLCTASLTTSPGLLAMSGTSLKQAFKEGNRGEQKQLQKESTKERWSRSCKIIWMAWRPSQKKGNTAAEGKPA